jgi:hypothetical protein
LLAAILAPNVARGCACGCGVFDVATESMLPRGLGGMLYLNYAYQDQNENWSNWHRAPSANNGDNDIRTDFVTVGYQYFFNRNWGVEAELPYDFRHYQATGGGANTWSAFGDARVKAYYTGFFDDMSAGLTLGLKLPTGDDGHDLYGPNALIDRDTELGTGSTDVLVGGFYRHSLTRITPGLNWFSQAELDVPALTQGGYRPGIEVDSSLGLYYQKLSVGPVRITPVAQVIPSWRERDSGSWAAGGVNDPPVGISDSGYFRVLLSPGLEVDWKRITIYADIEYDALQFSRGNQLVAPVLFKTVISYMF